jgi:uncharacterized membrane protein YkoI
MKKTIAGAMVAGAMAASLALFGCGGQQASSSAASTSSSSSTSSASSAQSTSQQQAPAETTADSTSSTTSSTTTQAPASQISAENAKQIALADAGLTESDVTELKAELDTDDAVAHYDVDFKAKGMEYDYDIDASTGAILNHNTEVDD